jgi:di/tricarboxylate transporter
MDSADWQMIAAAVIVVGTLAAMTSGKVEPLLALGAGLAIAGLLGIATTAELAAGLSNGGVITVGAMLVIAKGIVQTGAISRVTWALLSSVTSAQQALRRLMVPIGVASGLMNTTPIVAMLVPATRELEQTRRVPASQVLLPVAHVTTLAGSVTLIGTSSNLLIAGIAATAGVSMSMFSFASVALPVALVGWLIIYVTAPHLLHGRSDESVPSRDWRVEIPLTTNALLRGHQAGSLGVDRTQQFELVGIEHFGEIRPPDAIAESPDVLIFSATEAGVADLWASPLFGLTPQRLYAATVTAGTGRTLHDFENGALQVVAARTDKPLRDTLLQPGETIYLTADGVAAIEANDSLAMYQRASSRAPQPGKTLIALAILAAVVLSATFGFAPTELAAFTGALAMVVTGVLRPGSAARALDWKVLFILAGSIGLGTIVVTSGLADLIAEGIRTMAGGSPLLVVVVFAVATTLLTNLVTNAAAASILTPIGLTIAGELHVDPVLVLAMIGTAISFTFLNPFAHQTNLMVMRPGGYTSASFARFGVPLVIGVVLAVIAVTYAQL